MAWRNLGRLVACGLALAANARAQSPPSDEGQERYALSWVRGEGADQCPARADLAAEVTRRLGRSPFDDAAARSIEIQVEHGAHGYESRALVRDAGGHVMGRRVLTSDEATCAPLFSATALGVALLIDPEAAAQHQDSSAPGAVARFDEGSAPPAKEEPKPAAPAVEPVRATPPTPSLPAAPIESPPPVPAQHDAGVAGEGLVAFGLVPDVMPGAGLFVSSRGERWGWAANAFYIASATATNAGAEFDVGLTAFGISGTFDLLPRDTVRLALELGPSVGALGASVRSPTPTDPGDFLFLSVSAGARAQVELGSAFFVSLRGAAMANVVRRGLFVQGDSEPVWREPTIAGLLAFGAGVSFF